MRKAIIAAWLLMIATSCGPPQSILHPGGPAAQNLSTIGWVVFILLGLIALVMWLLLLWTVVRRRGSLNEHEPYNVGGGQRWIFVGGMAIPLVVLCGLFVFALERMTDFPLTSENMHPEIQIIGHQFWWEVHYLDGPVNERFVTANEIHIPVGKPVDLLLESADVIHSFWVPGLHGKMQLIPGRKNYLRIQASHPGEFPGQCTQFCGVQHAHMRLLVVAQTPAEYALWRQSQLNPAAEPQDAEAMHGRDVFINGPCALCHTVRGTLANGKVAPDLTHIASRKYIGANSFINNKADMGGWVTNAQSLKPGCEMPPLAFFNGQDLRALIDYLEELK